MVPFLTRSLLSMAVFAFPCHVLFSNPVFEDSHEASAENRPMESRTDALRRWHQAQLPSFIALYQWLHQNPEVSFEEKATAAKLAQVWRDAGFDVTSNVGGHGLVGILVNGKGPVVMIRTDLDALPITERTPLPFASKTVTTTADGGQSGVMHACGHDIHMTNLTSVASYMANHRENWSGTLMLIGQPAEERGAGARAMLEDGLFTKFPKPDFALALHCEPNTAAGKVGVRSGFILANVDSVDIIVRGRGGHGASPDATVDPIVEAAELILSLQSIVSREIKPIEPAVLTVGAIHGGTKHNIIGDEVHLQLTVRSYSAEVRAQILAAIERRAKGVAETCGAPDPEITISEGTPALENDRELAERMRSIFSLAIGSENVEEAEQVMGGEDFSQYGLAGVPILMYRLGVVAPERIERMKMLGVPLPSLHSAEFYPDLDGTLEAGFVTMTSGLLELMPK